MSQKYTFCKKKKEGYSKGNNWQFWHMPNLNIFFFWFFYGKNQINLVLKMSEPFFNLTIKQIALVWKTSLCCTVSYTCKGWKSYA